MREGAAFGLEWLIFSGWGVIVRAGIDLLMNLTRSGLELSGQKTALEFCLIAQTAGVSGNYQTNHSNGLICPSLG